MNFSDRSTTGVRGTGKRLVVKSNTVKWIYSQPGEVLGTTFGGGHMTGQTMRVASYLPIKEIDKRFTEDINRKPIVAYGGTIVALEKDAYDKVPGASSEITRQVITVANGGTSSVGDKWTSYDVEWATRLKATNAGVADAQVGTRPAIAPNKPVGALVSDAYQNMENVYSQYDPEEEGTYVITHGWAHYPYSNKNKVGSDAAWAIKQTVTTVVDAIPATGDRENTTWTLSTGGKIIKTGPLANDIVVEYSDNGSDWTDVTADISWDETLAANDDQIILTTELADGAFDGGGRRITAWIVRTAIVASITSATGDDTIEVDTITPLGTLAADDTLVDETGKTYVIASVSNNNIVVDDDDTTGGIGTATQTLGVGSRLTVYKDDSTIVGKKFANTGIESGDLFMSGQKGQPVKFTAGKDPEEQKLGKVFFVEDAGVYPRNAGDKVLTAEFPFLSGANTGGLDPHLYYEFGASASTARGMWVNFQTR